MSKFGARLKELRNKKKLTQKELSKILKISESAIGMYERDEREPSFDLVKRLADIFEVSIDYLLGRQKYTQQTERANSPASYIVAGQEINLTQKEIQVFNEMMGNPKFAVMFHDLAKDPEKKVKTLIKMWEVIKADLDEEDDRDDIIED
jgi:transcriptional regulator with XRE-family HTH domain